MNDLTKIEAQLAQEVKAWRRGEPGWTNRQKEQAKANREERDAIVSSLPRVSRDPCVRCGVRGDLPCAHRTPGG